MQQKTIGASAVPYFKMHQDADDLCLVPSCFKRPWE